MHLENLDKKFFKSIIIGRKILITFYVRENYVREKL